MNSKSKIILFAVILIVFGMIIIKPFLQSDSNKTSGIDTNPNYTESIAEAKSQGQPVFLEFYGEN